MMMTMTTTEEWSLLLGAIAVLVDHDDHDLTQFSLRTLL
jgi:hypothetical protein